MALSRHSARLPAHSLYNLKHMPRLYFLGYTSHLGPSRGLALITVYGHRLQTLFKEWLSCDKATARLIASSVARERIHANKRWCRAWDPGGKHLINLFNNVLEVVNHFGDVTMLIFHLLLFGIELHSCILNRWMCHPWRVKKYWIVITLEK